ncbi:hypothetical protein CYMTET_20443 [Cymbomonas tetramitiformis]|uniref:Uncharacterized protein n=1 Tax=Cymbomonas tetramitiformis TaxID=36881 RepID=A0AAE0G4A5_9CHLO|nr:hypothetical protein CYMTET_20443 [Cymbomonas tetramitiformis]
MPTSSTGSANKSETAAYSRLMDIRYYFSRTKASYPGSLGRVPELYRRLSYNCWYNCWWLYGLALAPVGCAFGYVVVVEASNRSMDFRLKILLALGVPMYCFWLIGWYVLLRDNDSPDYGRGAQQHTPRLPPGRLLDLISILSTAASFTSPSFQEGVTWLDTEDSPETVGAFWWGVGNNLPLFFRGLLFEFTKESFRYTCPAMLALLVLGGCYVLNPSLDSVTKYTVIQLLTDMLSVPFLNKMFKATSCTYVDGTGHLDAAPSIICWTPLHLWYFVPCIIFLIPYYFCTILGWTYMQASQTIIFVDPVFFACKAQLKAFVALLAANFGQSRPLVLLPPLFVANAFLTAVSYVRNPYNVELLSKVEYGGLLVATWSVLVALLGYLGLGIPSSTRLGVLVIGMFLICLHGIVNLLRSGRANSNQPGAGPGHRAPHSPEKDGLPHVKCFENPLYHAVLAQAAHCWPQRERLSWNRDAEVKLSDTKELPLEAITVTHIHLYPFRALSVDLHNLKTLEGLIGGLPGTTCTGRHGISASRLLGFSVSRAMTCFIMYIEGVLAVPFPAHFTRWERSAGAKLTDQYALTLTSCLKNRRKDSNALVARLATLDFSNLITLDLSGNSLGPEGAKALAEVLAPSKRRNFNSSLSTLIASENSLGGRMNMHYTVPTTGGIEDEQGLVALGQALKRNETLTHLALTFNTVGPKGTMALAEGLAANRTLRSLVLDRNWLAGRRPYYDIVDRDRYAVKEQEEGVQALAAALKENTCLTSVSLQANMLGPKCTMALAEGLALNKALRVLDMMHNPSEIAGALALAAAIRRRGVACQLLGGMHIAEKIRQASQMGLKDGGAIMLANDLVTGGMLASLDLFGQKIGPDGAKALAAALTPNDQGTFCSSLTTLNLLRTNMGDAGRVAILAAMEQNDSLTSACGIPSNATNVDLSGKNLGSEDALLLAGELVLNKSINTLNLTGNLIGPAGAAALGAALVPNERGALNATLHTLILDDIVIGDPMGFSPMNSANGIKTVNTLPQDAEHAMLDGLEVFGDALKQNKTLTSLSLRGNLLGSRSMAALADGLASNNSLRSLDLAGNGFCGIYDDGYRHPARLPSGEVREEVIWLARKLARWPTCSARDAHNKTIWGRARHLGQAVADHPTLSLFNTIPLAGLRGGTLTELDLAGRDIGASGAVALAELVAASTALRVLNVLENDLGEEGARSIIAAFEQSAAVVTLCGLLPGMKTLDLSGRHLRSWDMMLIVADQRKDAAGASISTLKLAGHRIGREGIKVLAAALTPDEGGALGKSLRALTLRGDGQLSFLEERYVGDVAPGFEALGVALQGGIALTMLDLTGSGMRPEGAVAFAPGLRCNGTIRTLILDNNRLAGRGRIDGKEREEGLRALGGALYANVALTSLSLQGNMLGPHCAAAFAALFVFNKFLHILNLKDNPIGKGVCCGHQDIFHALPSIQTIVIDASPVTCRSAAMVSGNAVIAVPRFW